MVQKVKNIFENVEEFFRSAYISILLFIKEIIDLEYSN